MAIWQNPFLLAPKSWMQKQEGKITRFLSDDGWELIRAWQNFWHSEDLVTELNSRFSPPNEILEDYWQWNSSKHDSDICVSFETGSVDEIRVRIDKRAEIIDLADIIEPTVDLCKKFELSILDMNRSTILSSDQFHDQYRI